MKVPTPFDRFIVRQYCARDFDRLWQIDQLCFPEGIAYTQMDLTGFIMKRNAITLVAETHETLEGKRQDTASGDRITGFVIAYRLRGQVARIATLDILPEARRLGLASRLMQECEQRLRAAGCVEVYLETAVNNEAALRLYRKLGYEIVRVLPEYYSSHSLDAFQMAKRI